LTISLTGRRENLAHLAGQLELIEGDIRDPEALRQAMDGVEVVFHEAAIPSVPRSVREPEINHDINVNGTFRVLLAARDSGVRRVVYAASSSAYGEIGTSAKVEDQQPSPLSPYAVAKLVGEYYCQVFTRVYGLETVALRYFNVFGPRQDPSSPYSGVISKFVTSLLTGQTPVIYGDGEQSRRLHLCRQCRRRQSARRGIGGGGRPRHQCRDCRPDDTQRLTPYLEPTIR
jgi:nucleoside-diphosphate-sugar epimerase